MTTTNALAALIIVGVFGLGMYFMVMGDFLENQDIKYWEKNNLDEKCRAVMEQLGADYYARGGRDKCHIIKDISNCIGEFCERASYPNRTVAIYIWRGEGSFEVD